VSTEVLYHTHVAEVLLSSLPGSGYKFPDSADLIQRTIAQGEKTGMWNFNNLGQFSTDVQTCPL